MAPSLSLALSFLLCLTVAWFILKPHLTATDPADPQPEDNGFNTLTDQKSRLLQMLRDLDLDNSTGKLSAEEYQQLRHELSVDLAKIMKEMPNYEEEKR